MDLIQIQRSPNSKFQIHIDLIVGKVLDNCFPLDLLLPLPLPSPCCPNLRDVAFTDDCFCTLRPLPLAPPASSLARDTAPSADDRFHALRPPPLRGRENSRPPPSRASIASRRRGERRRRREAERGREEVARGREEAADNAGD
ncbi:hypothetical protein DAI22_11g103401 [Oryza sativa Japonica Group]|nr:hypothetical protein DAI22_11g103401 [Oryza sativa Japonica Group]